MVTSVDVASYVGLSQATVSRALRGDGSVAAHTRERVLKAAKELGYVPDVAARMMVTRRSRAVGVVVGDLNSPIYPPILEALQSRLLERGYRMVLIRDPDALPDPDAVDVLSAAAVDGMVFVSARTGSVAVQRARALRTPIVLLSRDDTAVDSDAVLADDHEAGRLAVSHLSELGHRRVGILATPRDRSNGRGRENGARDAMVDLGLDIDESLVLHLPLTHEDGRRAAVDLLLRPDRPTALFCVADTLAFAAMDAATRLGITIPEQLSVVGVDDSGPSRWSFVNLTTVHQPVEDMAYDAIDRLVERIESADKTSAPRKTVFPVHLQIRGTTARPPQAVFRPPLKSSV